MGGGKMHADEVDTDEELVRRLLAAQFPRWAGLPVEPVASAGTVNAVYRLGDAMAVRLPRIPGGVKDVAAEARWLPRLAPLLPAPIPAPLAQGRPGEGYPWPWSVHSWLPGRTPGPGGLGAAFARDLAGFVAALQRIGPMDGPPAYRTGPLTARDAETRAAIATLRGVVDEGAATAVWETALRAPRWAGAPVWVHADLSPGNVLVRGGRLSAVIDFGCVGRSEPAVDLIATWSLLTAGAREVFRGALGVDGASWLRGRGWALSIALSELAYYRFTHPVMATTARHVVAEILADHRSGSQRPADTGGAADTAGADHP
ncbi:Predicted kinase, aminoglycoside phosphotransferase (APT) family [Streptomyces sp. DvalAA-14]|uniref:aminoglycoside phosphotransferase family protein n=1 Tax=unclassified Streptomyces TaxID=2593676 RepID=UPI00081B67CF|nr:MULTISPECIES: aminoglycoside phosphotransferase family protein [unclassified Streptomyces]MYS20610.1 phosphotransferase [Streptomyces sp. SID4948]SCD72873.1 Predicted kinase, aminoglycoside phosphotransferase (APT) family [Streptomyces sp. DvalAA-14]